ncbi:MAG: DUF6448 family protein [Kiritimatiellae bacterium]|nr:DUF6448 family protein [Kiritimatiellia bacterium]
MNKIRSAQIAVLALALGTGMALAHCDTTGGPIIPEAKAALEKGDVTPILKWIAKEHEAEIKTAFAKAVTVRAKGPEAQQLADQYFLETIVRLHRAGEGFAFTGIKDEQPEKIVQLSDQALAAGSCDDLIKRVQGHVGMAIREKFNKVAEAAKNKDKSVEAGRVYVAAYVEYTHFVEGIHAAVMSAGHHAAADAGPNPHAAHHED